MPRNRMIKPDFWEDSKLALNVCRDARLLYIGMWNYSDDHGVVKGHPAWLRGQVFPYDKLEIELIQKWLGELVKINCLYPFEQDGEIFYLIHNFLKHQKIDHPSKRRNPAPPEGLVEDSANTPRTLTFEYNKKENKKDNKKEKESMSGKPDVIPYQEIIDDLNRVTGKKYRHTGSATKAKITARFNDGFKLLDFQHVHKVKAAEWLGTDMEKFLRPETLYGNKFEGYLNQEIEDGHKGKAGNARRRDGQGNRGHTAGQNKYGPSGKF